MFRPSTPKGGRTITEDKTDPLGLLTQLIEALSPFLDSHGRAFCYIKPQGIDASDSETIGIVIELDSEPVSSLLSYRFYEQHLDVPPRAVIRQALDVARGKLWATQFKQPATKPTWSATIKAIVLSSKSNGGFTGSSSQVRDHLRDVVCEIPDVLNELPRNANQMGVVLVRIGLLLRQHNVELFRPPRTDRERLWCWRWLIPNDDTSDTPDTPPIGVSADRNAQTRGESSGSDAPDTSKREKTISAISGILQGSVQ